METERPSASYVVDVSYQAVSTDVRARVNDVN
jgi:hypothetical protein